MLSSTVSATDISLEIESSCGGLNHRKKYLERLEPSDIQEICRNETESHFVFSEATRRYESSPLARKRTRGTDHQDRPLKGTLGVRQIWVNESHRRGSIARALVDTAREHFAYGTVVMRPHIAFSQPTSDGLKFALAYSQQETIWAYA